MKESGDCKTALKNAKKRMKSGYWSDFVENRKRDLDIARQTGTSEQTVYEHYKKLASYTASLADYSEQEEEIYKKVCKILDGGECVINPLSHIIDYEYVGKLEYNDRQRYLLKMSATYRKMVERYNREKQLKIGF